MNEFTKAELNLLCALEAGLRQGDIFVPSCLLPAGMSRIEAERTLRVVCQKVDHNLMSGWEKR